MISLPARVRNAAQRLYQRLGLSTRGLIALALGITLLGVSLSSFAGVSEDVTQHEGLASHDPSRLQFFIHHRTPHLIQGARWVTTFGSVGILAIIALVVAVVLWLRGARLVMALAPGLALAAAGASAAIGKLLVGRARPPAALRLATETEASFPSGHTTDSTALYVTLALIVAVVVLRRPLARAGTVLGALLLSAGIGVSRLLLGVHWPTDVLAGWALGATVALAITLSTVLLSRFVRLDGPPPQHRLARLSHRLAHVLLLARPPKALLASRL